MRLRFLGTGASGGTPGQGRSLRTESSLLVVEDDAGVLIDVGRDFDRQAGALERPPSAVLLTHAHRDASGGIPRLRRWWAPRSLPPLPVHAHRRTIAALRARQRRLEHCSFVPSEPGRLRRVGPLTVSGIEVPHAPQQRFPTFAWRLQGRRTLVYASDVAELTGDLERACADADALVIDGAMWGRRLFSHLTIDAELPRLCEWPVGRILLTQIGRTAPPHHELARRCSRICARAMPAHDGLELEL